MNDGIGILLALATIIVPLALAWYLLAKYVGPREPSDLPKRKK